MTKAPSPNPVMEVWRCSRECGWYRAWNPGKRGDQFLDHPLHGNVTGKQAARLDIDKHNCGEFLIARDRIRRNLNGPKAEAAA